MPQTVSAYVLTLWRGSIQRNTTCIFTGRLFQCVVTNPVSIKEKSLSEILLFQDISLLSLQSQLSFTHIFSMAIRYSFFSPTQQTPLSTALNHVSTVIFLQLNYCGTSQFSKHGWTQIYIIIWELKQCCGHYISFTRYYFICPAPG